jgi:hypothetical protein
MEVGGAPLHILYFQGGLNIMVGCRTLLSLQSVRFSVIHSPCVLDNGFFSQQSEVMNFISQLSKVMLERLQISL